LLVNANSHGEIFAFAVIITETTGSASGGTP